MEGQNQGSLKNVKMASEVPSRVNFDAIVEQCWLPKFMFLLKEKLLEISPKIRTSSTSRRAGGGQWTSRMAPRKPPLAHALFKQETAVWAIVGHCSVFVAKKTGVGATKVKWLLNNSKVRSSWWGCYQKLIKTCWKRCSDYWNKCYYSGEGTASSWKKTQCSWSDMPWAKARRT